MMKSGLGTMLRNIDIDLLRCFATVADLRGFSRAAVTLGRSQSTISMQIRRLEEITGQVLLERSPQGVNLTRRGEEFLNYARRIVALHDEALDIVSAKALRGTVRLAVMDDYATSILPATLARFSRLHPEIELEVTTGFTRDLLRQLGNEFDLVLATHKHGTGKGEVLRIEKTSWACSDSHSPPAEGPLPLALLKPGNMYREWALDALNRAKRPWRIVFSSSSIGAVEAAAAAGMAVTVVKAGTARAGLRLMTEADGLPPLPLSEIALHTAPRRQTAASRALADHLVAELQEPAA
ncbi:MAG TPA: LysR substrate-binding domain-containing protein [Ferrovibrio sp.]|jgi:DNA-binding transcriptional LysR family regulator|uniref:LysR substrate-binding domain-containing protein n=1 Tax=Ferrovibrio sp. TaxID=1917215 RepID=UPI002B4AFAC9|nr:LysR substrate-binding domain-containing protein [Ferrovibrio sp.]HLT76763.1 LysR substrate-binding domain-containing protein [Ferrovibrio sp.]